MIDVSWRGSAVIAMAETQATHRQSIESNRPEVGIRAASRGQWFALAALVAMLILIGFTFYIGQPMPRQS